MQRKVLVVDDDRSVVAYLVEVLGELGYQVDGVHTGADALERVAQRRFDVVVSDVAMPGIRGTELVEALRARPAAPPVVLITAFGSIDTATEAVRSGAADFITKPFEIEALTHAIDRAIEQQKAASADPAAPSSTRVSGGVSIVAESPAMKRVIELARRAAQTDAVVLITGESGVGKGVVARLIHELGSRARSPFIQINCAALPNPLLESELFGVKRGAYTDAKENRPGLFVEADGGSLFFDEIGDLSAEAQPKLLHVLETGRIRPVGSSSEVSVDVRLIAATNSPLEEALRERRFRPDLYYRLNVIRIAMPALRERSEDLDGLLDELLGLHAAAHAHPARLSDPARQWLKAQAWPGNIRELSNTLERAIALTDHETLTLDDVRSGSLDSSTIDYLSEAAARGIPLVEIERAYVKRVLALNGGNVLRAAEALGIDRRTVYRKLEGE